MDHSFARGIGVNTEDLLVARPNSAENSLSIVNTLVNSGAVDVIVVDSVCMHNITFLDIDLAITSGVVRQLFCFYFL